MIKELSEQDFIDQFSEHLYQQTCHMAFNKMREMPEFKNDHPEMASLMVFPVKRADGTAWSLTIECTLKKLKRVDVCKNPDESTTKGTLCDFGIVRMWLSDEEMPDMALDRYNEYLKVKKAP